MTKITKEHAAFIDAFKTFNANVASQNQRKVADLALMLADAKVYAMMQAQNVQARDLNVALYTSEKAIKFVHALTREQLNAKDLELNTFCAMKSAVNALAINETLLRTDVVAIVTEHRKSVRDHIYVRKNAISADAQVNYTYAAINMLNVIDKATFKVKDCELVKLATERLKDVAL